MKYNYSSYLFILYLDTKSLSLDFDPVPLFTKQTAVLLQDLVKSQSHEIWV